MWKFFKWLVVVLVAAVALPPLWYAVFPEPPAPLPAAGARLELPSGVKLNVLEQGAGPTVVLVHGLPGSAYDWRELVPVLARAGYRVIAYDRVGYGHSDPRANADFSMAANTRELQALLQVLALEDVTLVGWSYGGAMAMQAAKDPRVDRLVLVGTGGPSSDDDVPPEPAGAMKLLYSAPVLRWRSAVPPVSRALQSALSHTAFSAGEQPQWWLPDLAANFSRWHTVLTYRGEIFAPIDPNGFDPTQIEQPTLIVHAEDDRLAPVAIGRYLASRIPSVTYLEVPGASHMLPVTHPQLLAEAIAEFVGSGR